MLATVSGLLMSAGSPDSALAQNSCNWGSFDASRINYSAGPLTGSAHTQLVGIINANSGTVVVMD